MFVAVWSAVLVAHAVVGLSAVGARAVVGLSAVGARAVVGSDVSVVCVVAVGGDT